MSSVWIRNDWPMLLDEVNEVIHVIDFYTQIHAGPTIDEDNEFLGNVCSEGVAKFVLAIHIDQLFYKFIHEHCLNFDEEKFKHTFAKLAYWFDGYHPHDQSWDAIITFLKSLQWFPREYFRILRKLPR